MVFALNHHYRWERLDTLSHHVRRDYRALRDQIVW
jgi:hypothetical protein